MANDNLTGEFILNRDNGSELQVNQEDLGEIKSQKVKNLPFVTNLHHGNPHFYSAFSMYPQNVKFENQEVDEEIIFLVRQAFITNIPWILLSIFLLFIPPFIPRLLELAFPYFSFSQNALIALVLFAYLIIAGFIILGFVLWYFRIAFLTNKRLIDVDIEGLLYKNIAETKLELIQDVSYTQVGVIRSIFNYGDILVQTAGSIPNFEFERAPKPAEIVRIIADLIGR